MSYKEINVETDIIYNPVIDDEFKNDLIIEKKEFNEKKFGDNLIEYKIKIDQPNFFSDFWDGFKMPFEIVFDGAWNVFKLGQNTKKAFESMSEIIQNPTYLILIVIIVVIIMKKI